MPADQDIQVDTGRAGPVDLPADRWRRPAASPHRTRASWVLSLSVALLVLTGTWLASAMFAASDAVEVRLQPVPLSPSPTASASRTPVTATAHADTPIARALSTTASSDRQASGSGASGTTAATGRSTGTTSGSTTTHRSTTGTATTTTNAAATASAKLKIPAKAYYVSCTGNDSGAGSQASPWRTLKRAGEQTLGADTGLYLQRGCTWSEKLEVDGSGTASAPVLVAAYGSGADPVITDVGETGNSAVALMGNHVQFASISISGAAGYAVQVFGQDALITDVDISDSGSGVRLMGSGAVVDAVRVRDLKMIKNTPGGTDDYGAVGFGVEASGIEIRNSSCVNCRAPSYDYGYDGGFVEVWNQGDNLYVHDNVATNTQGFMEVGGDSANGSADSIRIVSNTMQEVHGGIFVHTSGEFGISAGNLLVSGNTITNRQSGTNPVFGGDVSRLRLVGNTVIANQPVAFQTPQEHSGNTYYTNNLGFAVAGTERLQSFSAAK